MQDVCRDRYRDWPVLFFKLVSCSMCYKYLFHGGGNELTPREGQPWKLTPVPGSPSYKSNMSVYADITNQTVRDIVCSTLNDENCSRWTDCCQAAITCCHTQLSTPRKNISSELFCPRTWDGYGCFGDTLPGERVEISCPSYVEHATQGGKYIQCTVTSRYLIH